MGEMKKADGSPAFQLVVLLRHGESIANARGLRQGQTDLPLTPAGIQQAQALAQAWKQAGWSFDRVIASPLRRAFHTALIFAQALGIPVLETDPLWQERAIGHFALRPSEAVAAATADQFRTRFTPVGGARGESPWLLSLRAWRAWEALEARPSGRYLVVTHGGLLNMLFRNLLGHPPRTDFRGPYVTFPNVGYAVLARRGSRRWTWCGLYGPDLPVPRFHDFEGCWRQSEP